jgi:hypothetical protein
MKGAINRLMYDLYGLSEDEIKIAEGRPQEHGDKTRPYLQPPTGTGVRPGSSHLFTMRKHYSASDITDVNYGNWFIMEIDLAIFAPEIYIKLFEVRIPRYLPLTRFYQII